MELVLKVHFPIGYCGNPYWPEQQRLIDIQKESGFRRARSEQNRAKALTEYLEKHGMTHADYLALEKQASRPFVTAADEERMSFGRNAINGHDPEEIVIPPHHLDGCFANACDEARAATRVASRDQIRSILKTKPIYTGKTKPDGIWQRFVVVTSGTGAKLSNQRGLRETPYVGEFTGELTVSFNDALVRPERVKQFIEFAGREVGVGASRKMSWGRFEVLA